MNESAHSEAAALMAQKRRGGFSAPTARLASVRVSPEAYLAAACSLTFISFLLLRSSFDLPSLLSIALAWMLMPILAFTDRISFDGRTISRRGIYALAQRLLRKRRLELALAEIERVETGAVRTLRRGGRVRYRYRTEVMGKGTRLAFASGGAGYRRMIRTLLPLIADEKLDARSRELRDYLCDRASLDLTLHQLHLASPEVLEGATNDLEHQLRKRIFRPRLNVQGAPTSVEFERGALLRRAANELRAAGRLREAAEAFRRSLLVTPRDGWLIYEFARFLRSQASAIGDARLLARARAALKLAGRRGQADAALWSRIGESFFEFAEVENARRSFKRALELDPQTFRAEIGLAEVALRSGQLAHVIHHYDAAARIASDPALRRFARRESDYYARLNSDDEYLASELRRINWLQALLNARRISVRVTLASLLLALLGGAFEELASDLGWSIATSSLLCWMGVVITSHFLTSRRGERTAE